MASAAGVQIEVAISGIRRCLPQSANAQELKKKLMEQVDMDETARLTPDDDVDAHGSDTPAKTSQLVRNVEYKWNIRWLNVLAFLYLHAGAIYGIYLVLTTAKFATFLWGLLYGEAAWIGATAGAHRLWSHRAYKATWQLRLLLMAMHTTCFQGHLYAWVRDHRMHHKFTDTAADPYASHRGLFFSHMGWLFIQKHPDVINKGKCIDMSDITKDPIAMFQKRYYIIIASMLCVVFPTTVPWFFWNENWWTSFYIASVLRTTYFLHHIFLVNSFAHSYGYRPYNKNISAVQNKALNYLTLGEGWHNYHHVFPWDYKSAELPIYKTNWTLVFIHLMANIGWAYDLKTVPLRLVAKRALRTGDGSRLDQTIDHAEDDGYCQILYRKK